MKDYQGAIAVFKNYVNFHNSHSQQCPGIGESAIKELQSLVDKEKPMEADTHQEKDYYVEDISTEVLNCPKCGAEIWNEGGYYDKPDYCPYCGQRLDWKEDLKDER